MPIQLTIPEPLEQAGHTLREVLLRLDSYAKKRVQTIDASSRYASLAMQHVRDLDKLMLAIQDYEEAVLACLSSEQNQPNIYQMSRAELLAYREADPLYRLGWVRGHKAGVTQAAQAPDTALRLYAKHAALPSPLNKTAFIEGVWCLLAKLRFQLTAQAESITQLSKPSVNHGHV